jgi:hypothetical protein
MKKLLLQLTLIIGFYSTAQTDVIALKSHSGNPSEINQENSNFGLDESMFIDSVIYIGEDCYIEVRNAWGNFQSRDTICDNTYFKEHGYSYESASKMYRNNTVLVGFKKPNKISDNSKNWNRKNSTTWFVALLLSISLFYVVFPIGKKR